MWKGIPEIDLKQIAIVLLVSAAALGGGFLLGAWLGS